MLWLLLLAAPLAWLGSRRLVGEERVRRATIIALRAFTLALFVATLAGPSLVREHDALTVIAVVDVSDSMREFATVPSPSGTPATSSSNLEAVRDWLRGANRGREADDRFGMVVFDGAPAAVVAPTTASDYVDDGFDRRMREGTNIEQAIRYALAMFPPDTARRLVLISDGVATDGDALEAAQEAAGAPIDVAPIAYRVDREVMIERVEAPSTARPGQRVTVRVLLRSSIATPARLTLQREGIILDINGDAPGASRRIELAPGLNVETAEVEIGDDAVSRFTAFVEIPSDADTLAANNTAEAFTMSPDRGAALILNGVYGDGDEILADTLRAADFSVELSAANELPLNPLELQSYDLVVLQNVAADDLSERQHELLTQYVQELGGGLIMVGGYESFGAGGWIDTALEPVLPVHLDLPDEVVTPTAAIAIVLDRSNSMAETVLGQRETKQQIANEGAAIAVETLDPSDFVTVIAFSLFPDVVVPLQRRGEGEEIAEAIRSINSEGGTNLYPAMERAYASLRAAEAEIKHVVCLSDGQSAGEGFDALAARMKADGITVSTIAVGDQADRRTLANIAEAGGGQFHYVANPRVLPRIFVKDIRIMRRPMVRETPFDPILLASGSPITSGLNDPPSLGGYTMTRWRDDRTVSRLMETPEGEPLLAWWQAGLGRVAAFTSDAHENWARGWIAWPGYRRMWTQLARSTSRPAGSRDFDLWTTIEDDRLVIDLDATAAVDDDETLAMMQVSGFVYAPDGSAVEVRLRPSGPARFAAELPAPNTGSYVVALTPRIGGETVGLALGGVTRNSGVEFRRLRSDVALLQAISEETGGRVLDLGDAESADLFRRESLDRAVSAQPMWPLLLWLCVGFFWLDVAARRIAWDWPWVRSLLIAAGQRVGVSIRTRSEEVAASVGALREAGERVGREIDERRGEGRASSTSTGGERSEPAPVEYVAREPQAESESDPEAAARRLAEERRLREETRRRALDALKGRASSSDREPSDSGPADDGDADDASTTSSLLAAKRRARDRYANESDSDESSDDSDR